MSSMPPDLFQTSCEGPVAPPPVACRQWHTSAPARALLAVLGPTDVRLASCRTGPGPDRLDWHPDSDHGAGVFAGLELLRAQAVGPAFGQARDDAGRAIALAAAQSAPPVSAAVAGRFADPARWHGFGAVEATRRFRAFWRQSVTGLASTEPGSAPTPTVRHR